MSGFYKFKYKNLFTFFWNSYKINKVVEKNLKIHTDSVIVIERIIILIVEYNLDIYISVIYYEFIMNF